MTSLRLRHVRTIPTPGPPGRRNLRPAFAAPPLGVVRLGFSTVRSVLADAGVSNLCSSTEVLGQYTYCTKVRDSHNDSTNPHPTSQE